MTAWYLSRYHGTPDDPGVVGMFTDPDRVGHFAVTRDALEAEAPEALFSLLVATTMFQRRQDLQIMRVLRGISAQEAAVLTSSAGLLAAADACGCDAARALDRLLGQCDLRKDEDGQGACSYSPDTVCAPKRHAVLLKRYGHFGKVPTSLALTLRHGRRCTPGRSPTASRQIDRRGPGCCGRPDDRQAGSVPTWE